MVLLPNAPFCCSATLNGLNQGTRWQNVLHFKYPDGTSITGANLTALCNGVEAAWTAQIAPICNTNVTLVNVAAVDLNSRTGPIASHTPATPIAGTRTGTAMPTSVAAVASWTILNRYRGGHPRTYFPAGVLADVSQGHLWTTTFIGEMNTRFDALITALNGITSGTFAFQFIALSYYSGSHKTPDDKHPDPVLRPTPLPFPITDGTAHTRVDTQRRRLGKELA